MAPGCRSTAAASEPNRRSQAACAGATAAAAALAAAAAAAGSSALGGSLPRPQQSKMETCSAEATNSPEKAMHIQQCMGVWACAGVKEHSSDHFQRTSTPLLVLDGIGGSAKHSAKHRALCLVPRAPVIRLLLLLQVAPRLRFSQQRLQGPRQRGHGACCGRGGCVSVVLQLAALASAISTFARPLCGLKRPAVFDNCLKIHPLRSHLSGGAQLVFCCHA